MTQRYIGGLIYNPPGGYSGYFNGSSSLSISSSNTVLPTGTQDFCVEMWFSWQTQSGSYPQLIANPTTNGFQIYYDVASGLLAVGIFNVSNVITYTISQTALSGGWNHLAVTRSGNTFRLFLNGILQANGTNTISFASVTTQYIGSDGSRPYTGYLSNVRTVLGAIPTPYQTSSTTNGTAVFTPPNGALQAITSTALLTCAFATFRDGSTNNYTITVNSATVSTQNPFPLTTLPNPAQGNAGNGIFSMSQYQSLKQQNLWPAIDPYFDYTTLLLHGNGTNGAQNNTFLDSSTNNFTITRNGNTTQGTFTPYGLNWSNYFDGSGDYLTVASNAALDFGSGDFTIEGWFYFTSNNGSLQTVWAYRSTTGTYGGACMVLDGSFNITLYLTNSTSGWTASNVSTGLTASLNQWQHIALVRSGNTITTYKNGVAGTPYTYTTSIVGAGGWSIMAGSNSGGQEVQGYVSNYRIVKGTAVYTTNFTPSTSPLTAITNTSLLTCQSNRFIDNSTNNFTITRNGDVSVQRFSPFNPSAPYAAGTIGGSGYFDGSGDYLTYTGNSSLAIGTGAFTMEFWLYKTVAWGAANYTIMEIRGNFTMINLNSGADLHGYLAGSDVGASGTTIGVGQWYHIVMARNGSSSLAIWVNGTRIFSSTNSTNVAGTDVSTSYIGSDHAGQTVPACYIADSRIVVGTDVYGVSNSTITVPTAPLTAVTNTKLLCSYTNGGIIDNAQMNDLETVGNAQISTTQSKFGGASLYFDGSGDYLKVPTTQNVNFGTGNFTIEFWAYWAGGAFSTYNFVFDSRSGASPYTDGVGIAANITNGYWYISFSGQELITSTAATAAWQHIALVRNNGVFTLYVNGISGGTYTATNNMTSTTSVIGTYYNRNQYYWNGYIDDFRITKGIARYTSNFTPQTSQWQDQ